MDAKTIAIIITLVLGLFVILLLTQQGKQIVYNPAQAFTTIFSLEKRCDERTPSNYADLIKGYEKNEQSYYADTLCKRFSSCVGEFDAFKEKNPESCPRVS